MPLNDHKSQPSNLRIEGFKEKTKQSLLWTHTSASIRLQELGAIVCEEWTNQQFQRKGNKRKVHHKNLVVVVCE